MNITITNLKILTNNSYLGVSISPLFVNSNYFKSSIFHGLVLRYFFSSLLYSSISSFTNYSLTKSKFDSFINTPVLFLSKDSNIKVQNDVFKNCKQRAICINETAELAIITNCIFENCQISKNGGAIFSKSRIFECHFCCFYYCTTVFEGWWGSAIYVHDAMKSNITQISVFNCPPPQQESPDMDSQVSIYKGQTNCRFHNYTSGRHRFSSGLRISHTKENFSILRFITTNQHKSGNALSFVRIYFDGDFSYINFINNTCNLGVLYLYMTDLCISYSVFSYNIGKIAYSHADAKISLISCVLDKNDNDFIEILETFNCTIKRSKEEILSFNYLYSCKY